MNKKTNPPRQGRRHSPS